MIARKQIFPLDESVGLVAPFARMDSSKHLSPSPTELIDWLNAEGLLDLEWDFPEDGDLFGTRLFVRKQIRFHTVTSL